VAAGRRDAGTPKEPGVKTQVGIIGAGPAGLVLSHLLALRGIESVVLEARSREYVEHRVRAGVLEHGTVELLTATGVGERLQREGLPHDGVELLFEGEGHRIDFKKLTGRGITLYGQQEVVKDLIAARLDAGGTILFDAPAEAVEGLTSASPVVRFRAEDREQELASAWVAGCDGYHGISRAAVPPGVLDIYERDYPFAWLGILAEAPPSSDELIYSAHDRGFALASMRSPRLSRLYVQCAPEDTVDDWPDERVWGELHRRLERHGGWDLPEGPVIEKVHAALRGFVAEPLRYGRLLLAGDSAHIVPATGAKGLNLAVADVCLLADGLVDYFASGDTTALDTYSDRALRRVWRAQHFSWWMTSMLHRYHDGDAFRRKLQLSQLHHVTTSEAAATTLAENYVGLPLESSFLERAR
jgi:p-hydroxybenzoate 3-monooxygenase